MTVRPPKPLLPPKRTITIKTRRRTREQKREAYQVNEVTQRMLGEDVDLGWCDVVRVWWVERTASEPPHYKQFVLQLYTDKAHWELSGPAIEFTDCQIRDGKLWRRKGNTAVLVDRLRGTSPASVFLRSLGKYAKDLVRSVGNEDIRLHLARRKILTARGAKLRLVAVAGELEE